MLVNSQKILEKARKEKYAIPHFNTSNLEITQAIIEAAAKMNSPVIIGTSERAIEYGGLETLSSIIKTEAQKVKIPVTLHLDHGRSLKLLKQCLRVGYTSIMIDGSGFSLKENIQLTGKAIELSRYQGVPVEGEIGVLKIQKYNSDNLLTDPVDAKEFVEKTGVNSLAVAIGNAHGLPVHEEKLDFERLKKISELIQIPLVLHGASSTPPKDIKKAISLGIAKINIDTDIRVAFANDLKEFFKKHPDIYDPREILSSAKEAVKKVVEKKIKLFGSANKL